jgi:endogenous inhibitor of DNA gyrase (YacG/DUF329 family)
MQPIKNKCLNCNKLFIDKSKNKVKKYCSKYCGGFFLSKFKRKFKDIEEKNCKICNKKFKDKSKGKTKKYCSRKCCLTFWRVSGKRKEALKRYRQTKHCKEQQKKYRLSKKGIIKRKKNAKILWQNIKLARKFKNLKLKNKKLNIKQKEHLEKFDKYLIRILKDQRKYRSNPKVLKRKKISDKKYYLNPINKEKQRLYRKKYYSTDEGKAKMNAKTNKRRAAKLNAIVAWTNLEKIKEIYKNCPKGYHVDHIVPLQAKNVSGLHVENNLQYLTAKQNISKGNKFFE